MIEFGSVPREVQSAFRILSNYLLRLRSVPLEIVADVAGLPKAANWQGRQIIVRNIGAGVRGVATAIDGTWYKNDGSAL